MRYPPEQVEQLAAEYVVGTLHGAARRRFDALMRDRADVRLSVWEWEQLLHPLGAALQPVQPPRSVWAGIHRRITGEPLARRTRWWPRFAIAVPILAALAFWLTTITPPAVDPDRMAIFADEAQQSLWVISADADKGILVAESPGVTAAPDNQVYELWALPEGQAPVSLGVLDITPGRRETALSAELLAAIDNSANLAISLEPPGGSPTGAPTGPVVHQASLVRL